MPQPKTTNQRLIPALTIKQPWAQAVATKLKRFENRTWGFSVDKLPLRIAIHAGLSEDSKGMEFCSQYHMSTRKLTHGAIIALATVTQFCSGSPDPWFSGPIGWQLEHVKRIKPIPCVGARGLWMPPRRIQRTLKLANEDHHDHRHPT